MFIILDGTGLAYRTLFAHPTLGKLMKDNAVTQEDLADTHYTEFAISFLEDVVTILQDVIRQYGMDEHSVLIAFDQATSKIPRNNISPTYSAKRATAVKHPSIYLALERLTLDLCIATPRFALSYHDWEADDVIAAITTVGALLGDPACIVSRDKDLLSLLSADNVTAYNPWNHQFTSVKTFYVEYGFTPEWFPCYKAIVGDVSDNITGVKRWGKVRARKVILEAIESGMTIVEFIEDTIPEEHRKKFDLDLSVIQLPFGETTSVARQELYRSIADTLEVPNNLKKFLDHVYPTKQAAELMYKESESWLL